jgi:glycosyltransferase involved in cell wall biosynthesis
MPIERDPAQSPATRADPPLTVGYVLKMFPRFSETFILNEILELERRGVRVVIFSMKAPDEPLRQPRVAEVRATVHVLAQGGGRRPWTTVAEHARCLARAPVRYVRTCWFTARRGNRAAWAKFRVAPRIVRLARQAGVEHFHAHFASGPARQAKLASLLSGISYSFTAHAKDLYWRGHQHGRNNKLKKRVRLASHVVTISEYNRRFIEGLDFKLPRRRLVTVYNGLDLRQWPWTRPSGRPVDRIPAGAPLLLAVGRLVEKKGFAVLLVACALLRQRGLAYRCLIVGDGPQRGELSARIAALGLGGRVELPGSVPQDRLREELFPEACVLVQPSVVGADGDQDGIPTVILEAMAAGLPVVSTAVSGIGEAVIDGETGLLCPPGDAVRLADAIARVMGDPSLAARLAAGARAMIEKRFDLANNAKILIHLMESAARGGPRWSLEKLRERAGVPSAAETSTGGEEHVLVGDR